MLEFRGTYFTTSSSMKRKTKLLYLLHYFVHAETIWWKNEKHCLSIIWQQKT